MNHTVSAVKATEMYHTACRGLDLHWQHSGSGATAASVCPSPHRRLVVVATTEPNCWRRTTRADTTTAVNCWTTALSRLMESGGMTRTTAAVPSQCPVVNFIARAEVVTASTGTSVTAGRVPPSNVLHTTLSTTSTYTTTTNASILHVAAVRVTQVPPQGAVRLEPHVAVRAGQRPLVGVRPLMHGDLEPTLGTVRAV